MSPSEGETDNDDMIKEIYSPEKIKPGTENHFGVDIDDVAHTHHRSIKGFFNEILPEEFDEGKWFDLYLHRLLLEHSWLCIFAPYKKGRGPALNEVCYQYVQSHCLFVYHHNFGRSVFQGRRTL